MDSEKEYPGFGEEEDSLLANMDQDIFRGSSKSQFKKTTERPIMQDSKKIPEKQTTLPVVSKKRSKEPEEEEEEIPLKKKAENPPKEPKPSHNLTECFASYCMDILQDRFDPSRASYMDTTSKSPEDLEYFNKDRDRIQWVASQIRSMVAGVGRFLLEEKKNPETSDEQKPLFTSLSNFLFGDIHPGRWKILHFEDEKMSTSQIKCFISKEVIRKGEVYQIKIFKKNNTESVDEDVTEVGDGLIGNNFCVSEYWMRFLHAWVILINFGTVLVQEFEAFTEGDKKADQDFDDKMSDYLCAPEKLAELLTMLQHAFQFIAAFIESHPNSSEILQNIDKQWFEKVTIVTK